MSGIQRIYRHESTEFTSVPNWVVRDPNYSPNVFRLLAYLLSHQSGYELTYGQIERQTTLGRYAINEAAKFLIASGWLEWSQEKGPDGKYLAKTWIIKNPNTGEMTPVRNDSTTEPIHYGTINGHKEENLLEKNTSKRKTLTEAQERELFNEFWKEYPRKLDKGAAFRAFRAALKIASFEEILAGAIAYRNDPNREAEYTKYPATWLNADSWENEISPSPDSEAAERSKQRRNRELEASRSYLAELKAQEAEASAPKTCRHGKNLALCLPCSKETNA
jgi:uncharacterized protein YeaO (DUF488 family)